MDSIKLSPVIFVSRNGLNMLKFFDLSAKSL